MASKLEKFPKETKLKKFNLGCDVDKEEIFTYPYLTDAETISFIKVHRRIMIIIRGPNSTLKATLSEMILNQYSTAVHCCADHYFSKTFNAARRTKESLKLSHIYCEKKVEQACFKEESPIIIQNTHMRKSELQRYLDMASEYSYTVIMAITLYKFNVTPEALEAINPDGLDINYFRNRLRQWEDIPPLFVGWFLAPNDSCYILSILKKILPALLNDGKFCRIFDLYDNDGIWNYFVARKQLCLITGHSSNMYLMKGYYLSDTVQEAYGKSCNIIIHSYLITKSAIFGIVHINQEMLRLFFEEKKTKYDFLSKKLSSLDVSNYDYNATTSFTFDEKNLNLSSTATFIDWEKEIDTQTCSFLHLAQKKAEHFNISDTEDSFFNTIRLLKTKDLTFSQLENDIQICRLEDNKWILKMDKQIKVKAIFTGHYI